MVVEFDVTWLGAGLGLVVLIIAVYVYLTQQKLRQQQSAIIAAAETLPTFADCGDQ